MKAQRHLYDHIVYDSTNERDFATDLDTNADVAVYVKLPDSFYIATPVGHYNPDWAIAFYEGTVKHIYFVAETKALCPLCSSGSLRNPKSIAQESISRRSATEMWYMMWWTATRRSWKK